MSDTDFNLINMLKEIDYEVEISHREIRSIEKNPREIWNKNNH